LSGGEIRGVGSRISLRSIRARIRGNCQNQRSLTVTVSPGRTGAISGTFWREVTPDAERLMSAS